MPPKKCVESVKPAKKQMVKLKTAKPPLRTPSVIRVRIPVTNANGCNGMEPHLTKKDLTLERKIDLANEVALSALNYVAISPKIPGSQQTKIENSASKRKRKSTPIKCGPKRFKNKSLENGFEDCHTEVDAESLKNGDAKRQNTTGKKRKSSSPVQMCPNKSIKKEAENGWQTSVCEDTSKLSTTKVNSRNPKKKLSLIKKDHSTDDLNIIRLNRSDSDDTFQPKSPKKFCSSKPKVEKNTDFCKDKDVKLAPLTSTESEDRPDSSTVDTKTAPKKRGRKKKVTKKAAILQPATSEDSPGKENSRGTVENPSRDSFNSEIISSTAIKISRRSKAPENAAPTPKAASVKPKPKAARDVEKSSIRTRQATRNDHPPSTEASHLPSEARASPCEESGAARPVAARKLSHGSNNSALSWTHDISSSSLTSLTVGSNDFVRFDRKLPIVKVTKVDRLPSERAPRRRSSGSESDSSSSSSSSSSRSSSSTTSSSSSGRGAPSPRLSTSSRTSPERRAPADVATALVDVIDAVMRFDETFVRWLASERPPAPRALPDPFDVLRPERAALRACRDIARLLDPAARPPTPPPAAAAPDHDDDDALSLFAESITGFESSRAASVVPSASPAVHEYVPAPLVARASLYSYRPTEVARPPEPDAPAAEPVAPEPPQGAAEPPPDAAAPTPWAAPPPVPETALFRHVCFHHLVQRCPFAQCLYRHEVPSAREVEAAAGALDEATLRRELALVRRHAALRRYEAALEDELRLREGSPLEQALRRLNTADRYEEALGQACGGGTIADEMLAALAESPHLERLKPAFCKLARWAVSRGRRVPARVAAGLLRRAAALPPDAAVWAGAVAVARLSDPAVWRSPEMARFEAALAAADASRGAAPAAEPPSGRPEPLVTRTIDDFKRPMPPPPAFNAPAIPPLMQGFREPFWPKAPPNGMYPRNNRRYNIRRPMQRNKMASRPYMQRLPGNLNRQINYGYNANCNRFMRKPPNGI